MFGRLGCNGRSCHGSFQGQGGFRLSLFGYDFKADHDALLEGDEPRVNRDQPAESLIIAKPTDEGLHEGGQRYELGSWQHHIILRWIAAGANFEAGQIDKLVRLEIEPSELRFTKAGQQAQLRAVAVWEDGSREDVTPLCRFQTNNEQIAKIDENGLVTSNEPGDTHLVVSYDQAVVPIMALRPVSDQAGDKYPDVPAPTEVDRLVVQKLRKLGIVQSETCTDAEFLRRVRLDLTGTLPSAAEVEEFLADQSPNKRQAKIDQLLETPAYAAWWTTRLCDFTGNNTDALNNVSPARNRVSQEWYDWIYKRVSENVPYDELIAGIVTAQSRNPDESYAEYCENMSRLYHEDAEGSFADRHSMPYYWARRDLVQPEDRAIGFAYSFMGIRIQCAQCHKHPFDQWSKQDFEDFKAFFAAVSRGTDQRPDSETREQYGQLMKELDIGDARGNQARQQLGNFLTEGKVVPFPEIYVTKAQAPAQRRGNQNNRGRGNVPTSARLLGGDKIDLTQVDDPREPLMEWLRDKDNPYFARAFVNRVWASYFNVGIVNPPDDLSLANPPSNRPLLDYLAAGFVDSGFDMKWLHREIANSRTYQLSWQPNETNAGDELNFSRAVPRRLPAEVAYDALQQATADDETVEKLQNELQGRAIAIASSSRRGARGGADYALTIFGRSTRESNCDCDRSAEASLLQTVFLQNDQEVLQLLDRRGGWISQIARQTGGRQPEAPSTARVPDNVREQIAAAERRLRRLRESGDEQAAKQLEDRLQQIRRRFGDRQPEPPARRGGDQQQEAKPVDTAALVKQAYLRTLSRYPSDDELARCREHLEQASDPTAGTRDLVWALINTKEFIVNH
ncbi:MAG: DUF1549 domain-containing protein [Pirellulaceae bacterium]|nr:DUF1549 domain-containing protein [Pirellulaceae bacterium]